MNINLHHCVKMRKNFPSQKVKHALTLGGLFSGTVCNLKALKWQSRKSRSKRNSSPTIFSKPSVSIQTEKIEETVGKLDSGMSRKLGQVMIQYYRKRHKSKACGSEGVSNASVVSDKHPSDKFSAADGGYRDEKDIDASRNTIVRVEGAGNGSSRMSFLAYGRKSKLPCEDQVTMSGGNLNENPSPPKLVDSSLVTAPVTDNIDAHTGNGMSEELMELNKNCDLPLNDSQKLPMIDVAKEIAKNYDVVNSENSAGSLGISVCDTEISEVMRENKMIGEVNTANRIHDLVIADDSERECNIQADGDVLMKETVETAQSCPDADDSYGERFNQHLEAAVLDDSDMTSGKVQNEIQPSKGDDQERTVSNNVPMSSKSHHTLTEEHEAPGEMAADDQQHSGCQSCLLFENKELDDAVSTVAQLQPSGKSRSKRKREDIIKSEDETNFGSFSRSPCERLRPRIKRDAAGDLTEGEKPVEDQREGRKVNKHLNGSLLRKDKKEQTKGSHKCSIQGCRMSFQTKAELVLHMRDRCPVKGCGKKFNSHKNAISHQRVHDDDRPLKCPWKGCTMTFKWAWARTEHIRVHTGERPYKCKVEGCGLTFRFVSDFSRHRRKTGHYVNQPSGD